MNGFHTQKNLFFERLDNGGVRVTKYPDDTHWLAGDDRPSNPPLFVQELDADTWCSVIASMSAGNELDLRFFAAREFHQSTGPIAVTPKAAA